MQKTVFEFLGPDRHETDPQQFFKVNYSIPTQALPKPVCMKFSGQENETLLHNIPQGIKTSWESFHQGYLSNWQKAREIITEEIFRKQDWFKWTVSAM